MKNNNHWNQSDLTNRGLVEVSPGVWEKVRKATPKELKSGKIPVPPSQRGRSKLTIVSEELQDSHILLPGLNGCRITLVGLTAGLNTKGGLMKQHFIAGEKDKKDLTMRLKALNCMSFGDGPVVIEFIRHTATFMDVDNLGSSFKKVGDSLVRASIINDDNYKILTKLIPSQVKAKRKEQYMEIIICYAK